MSKTRLQHWVLQPENLLQTNQRYQYKSSCRQDRPPDSFPWLLSSVDWPEAESRSMIVSSRHRRHHGSHRPHAQTPLSFIAPKQSRRGSGHSWNHPCLLPEVVKSPQVTQPAGWGGRWQVVNKSHFPFKGDLFRCQLVWNSFPSSHPP